MKKKRILPERLINEKNGLRTAFFSRTDCQAAFSALSYNKLLILSFFLPVLIMAFAYSVNTFFPVGDKTPLTIDLYHQYTPFLFQLRDKAVKGQPFFYSFNTGLGTNFYAEFAYYLASPLNIILLLFPPEILVDAVTVLTLLKLGLAGLSTALFLRFAFDSKKNSDLLILMCSAAFSLSGYMMTYSWNIMWLDALYAFPIMLLGLVKIVKGEKAFLYILSMSFIIFTNYYIAIFACLFSFFYFFAAYVSYSENKKPFNFSKTFIKYISASILSALTTAVLTLPTYISLRQSSASGDMFPKEIKMEFSIFNFLAKLLIGNEPDVREGLPSVYVGVFIFLVLPLYFLTREIKLRERAAHGLLAAFLFLSFSNKQLSFIWHGMHYPNQLPYRYAFVFSMLMLICGYRALCHIRKRPPGLVLISAAAAVFYMLTAEELLKSSILPSSVYLSIAFTVIYALFLSRAGEPGKLKNERNVIFMLVLSFFAELILNSVLSVSYMHKNEYYTARSDFNNDIREIRSNIAELEKRDPGFWRMEISQQKTSNSPALYGYRGISLFSSASPEAPAVMMRKLGFHGNNINSYKYMSATEFTDSLFGVKYIIDKEKEINKPSFKRIKEFEPYYVYENENALPLAFMADEEVFSLDDSGENSFSIQNLLASSIVNCGKIFEESEIKVLSSSNLEFSGDNKSEIKAKVKKSASKTELKFTVMRKEDSQLYLYLVPKGELTVKTEGRENVTTKVPEIIDIGYDAKNKNEEISISAASDKAKDYEIYAASVNKSALNKFVSRARKSAADIREFKDGYIKASVNVEDGGYLFFTLPYDSGWRIKVDGKNERTVHAAKAFMAISLGRGNHEIELRFVPEGFYVGLFLSLAAILLLLILIVVSRMKNRAKMRISEENEEI